MELLDRVVPSFALPACLLVCVWAGGRVGSLLVVPLPASVWLVFVPVGECAVLARGRLTWLATPTGSTEAARIALESNRPPNPHRRAPRH